MRNRFKPQTTTFLSITIAVLSLLFAVGVWAATGGGTDAPAGPTDASAQMFTLEQIYQRLTSGAAGTEMATFTEPTAGPGTGTMYTLDQIMEKAQPGALAKRVAKTGQTLCYNAAGSTIDCAGTGQDGEKQMGIDPVVVPSSGTNGSYNTPAWTGVRFTDNGDGTVTDNLTALIWLKNANCDGAKDWETALNEANTLANGTCGLTDGSVAGDWRLPNVNELHSLIDLTQTTSPKLPSANHFTGVQSFHYWSSTSHASRPSDAWLVYLPNGTVYTYFKYVSFPVWPVRGGQ